MRIAFHSLPCFQGRELYCELKLAIQLLLCPWGKASRAVALTPPPALSPGLTAGGRGEQRGVGKKGLW